MSERTPSGSRSHNPLVPLLLAFLGTVAVLAAIVLAAGAAGIGGIGDLLGSDSRDGSVFFSVAGSGPAADVEGAVEKPPISSVRLWSNGDSTSFFMSVELFDQMAARGAAMTQLEAEYQNGTGLITVEYFDWPSYLRSEMEEKDPNLVVFMIGANDAKFIGDPEEYRARVVEAMDLMEAPERRVIWVGQPNSTQPKLAANVPTINAIFREEAAKRLWVTFVDTWTATSDENGNYSQVLPAADGQLIRARADDGVHFTQEGGRILAGVVMEAISGLYR